MVDIVNAFAEEYLKRVLITGMLNPRDKALDGNVLVKRIIAYKRDTPWKRLLTWMVATLQIWILLLFRYPRAHVFLVTNPPFATWLPLMLPHRFSLLIFDVYPEALVATGMVSPKHRLVKLWHWINCKVYRKAERIFTISNTMKALLAGSCEPSKIQVVHLWTDSDFIKPIAPSQNPFVREQSLEGKFVVLYSGNLGKTHDLQCLVTLAKRLQATNIFFLIIGQGEQYDSLHHSIQRAGLSNMRLLPWQPTHLIPYTFAAASVGVVSLGAGAGKLSIPSKTYNYLSAGVPLLAIGEPDSSLAELMDKHEMGKIFRSAQIDDMTAYLLDLASYEQTYQWARRNALSAAKQFTAANARQFTEA